MTIFDLALPLTILINIFVLALFALLIYIIYGFYKIDARKEEKRVRREAYEDSREMLEDARRRSLEIIKETNAKSHEILQDADFLNEDTRLYLKSQIDQLSKEQMKSLEEVSGEVMTAYLETLEEEKSKGVKAMQSATKDFQKIAIDELEEFKEAIHKETKDSKKAVEQKLTSEYDQAHSEIANYQQEQMAKVDSQIYEILYKVTEEVMGKGIKLENQEALVMEALETAKKDNIV